MWSVCVVSVWSTNGQSTGNLMVSVCGQCVVTEWPIYGKFSDQCVVSEWSTCGQFSGQ